MFVSAEIEVKDGEDKVWKLVVDSKGEVDIHAPCGTKVTIKAGRKGKFFSDFTKAYKKVATAVGVFDSPKEEVSKEQKNKIAKNEKLRAEAIANDTVYDCPGDCGDCENSPTDWCYNCERCVDCCECGE